MLGDSRNSKEVNVSGLNKLEIGRCRRLASLEADAQTESP